MLDIVLLYIFIMSIVLHLEFKKNQRGPSPNLARWAVSPADLSTGQRQPHQEMDVSAQNTVQIWRLRHLCIWRHSRRGSKYRTLGRALAYRKTTFYGLSIEQPGHSEYW